MKEVTCTVSKVFVPVQQILTLQCPIFRTVSYLMKNSYTLIFVSANLSQRE